MSVNGSILNTILIDSPGLFMLFMVSSNMDYSPRYRL